MSAFVVNHQGGAHLLRESVYDGRGGRSPAWRGKTHEVAVALGLKPNPAKTSA